MLLTLRKKNTMTLSHDSPPISKSTEKSFLLSQQGRQHSTQDNNNNDIYSLAAASASDIDAPVGYHNKTSSLDISLRTQGNDSTTGSGEDDISHTFILEGRDAAGEDDIETHQAAGIDVMRPSRASESIGMQKRTGNIPNSVFNLSNAALGAGILAFPFAFKSAGLLLGLAITTILVGFASVTLHAVAIVSHQYNCPSYQDAISVMLGKKVQFVAELILMLYLLGACSVYLTVIGNETTPPLNYYATKWFGDSAAESFFLDRRFIITVLSLVLVFPLCLLKEISKLAFSSVIACAGGLYLVVFVVVEAIAHFASEGISDSVNIVINTSFRGGLLPEIFMAFPLIAFAFHCHVQLVPVYYELKNPSIVKGDIIIGSSLLLCNVLYVLTGIFGYLRFGHDTLDDILLNYDHSSVWANLGRLAMRLRSSLSEPLLFFTVRLTVQSLFLRGRAFSNLTFYLTTIIFFVVTLFVALFVPGVSIVFGICGAVGACSLMFVFPGLIIMSMSRFIPFKLKLVFVPLSVFYIALGLILAVCGVSVTILQMLYTEEY